MPASGKDEALLHLISKMKPCVEEEKEDADAEAAVPLEDCPASEADELRAMWGLAAPSRDDVSSDDVDKKIILKRQEVIAHLQGKCVQIMESDDEASFLHLIYRGSVILHCRQEAAPQPPATDGKAGAHTVHATPVAHGSVILNCLQEASPQPMATDGKARHTHTHTLFMR